MCKPFICGKELLGFRPSVEGVVVAFQIIDKRNPKVMKRLGPSSQRLHHEKVKGGVRDPLSLSWFRVLMSERVSH
jgi:hypothetical protein